VPSHRRAKTQLLVGSMSFLRGRLGVDGVVLDRGERCGEMSVYDRMQAGCRRQVMMPIHTPKDRDETAWRGCS
jgi:hypothetical protein